MHRFNVYIYFKNRSSLCKALRNKWVGRKMKASKVVIGPKEAKECQSNIPFHWPIIMIALSNFYSLGKKKIGSTAVHFSEKNISSKDEHRGYCHGLSLFLK